MNGRGGWNHVARAATLALVSSAFAGCCDCPCADSGPPPIAPTAGDEAPREPTPAPAPRGIDEGRALELAIGAATDAGIDLAGFDDIVVHRSGDGRAWEVQFRRPHILRYVFVLVDRESGATEVEERSR